MHEAAISDMLQPQQKRSRDAIQRMLEAGRRLLNERDIDQISVQDIVHKARSSVGSFYHHFGNKDAFFHALVTEMARNRFSIAMANYASVEMSELPAALVRGAIENHRRYQGMLRSAIRQHLAGSPVWQPITRMGQKIADEYVRRLEEDLKRSLSSSEKKRVAFAFIWLYGILAQSVLDLNTLLSYSIPDDVFEEETVSIFSSLLERATGSLGTAK